MKKRLTSITPLRAGIVLGILYGIIGLIAVPLFMLGALFGSRSGLGAALGGVLFAMLLPFIYAAIGFVAGLVVAAIYNLIAKWTGGLEFGIRDVESAI